MRKDFGKKTETCSEAEFADRNGLATSFSSTKAANDEDKDMGLALTKDMSQTICMFQRYLFPKTNVGNTRCPRPLCPPKLGSSAPRSASFLEQKLLPGVRSDAAQVFGASNASAAQLTIFYAGAINVYDNVPADKARAVLLLAGESSLSKPDATLVSNTETEKLIRQPCITSACKLKADLPIARRLSLKHFLEKRRLRLTGKTPYSPPATGNREHESTTTGGCSSGEEKLSLPPFPSRLQYFSPVLSADVSHRASINA